MKTDEAGSTHIIGQVDDPSFQTINNIIRNFNKFSGCTWRVGKTSAGRVRDRGVTYECLHREPTHLNEQSLQFKVGNTYMLKGDDSGAFVCVRVHREGNVVWLYDKCKKITISSSIDNSEYYGVGSSNKTFGCKATLKFEKVNEGISVINVSWKHNHNLNSFASTKRRDPADFVKKWFAGEYAKGVPAMRALRRYVDQLFECANVPSRTVVKVLSDR